MELCDFPKQFTKYWEKLSSEEQGVAIACLKAARKPMLFSIRVPATLAATAKILTYLAKHKLEPIKVEKAAGKLVFHFDKHSIRNEVYIGMMTL